MFISFGMFIYLFCQTSKQIALFFGSSICLWLFKSQSGPSPSRWCLLVIGTRVFFCFVQQYGQQAYPQSHQYPSAFPGQPQPNSHAMGTGAKAGLLGGLGAAIGTAVMGRSMLNPVSCPFYLSLSLWNWFDQLNPMLNWNIELKPQPLRSPCPPFCLFAEMAVWFFFFGCSNTYFFFFFLSRFLVFMFLYMFGSCVASRKQTFLSKCFTFPRPAWSVGYGRRRSRRWPSRRSRRSYGSSRCRKGHPQSRKC